MDKRIYLDNAATTRMSDEVLNYMLSYLKEEYGNPSSIYDLGADNKRALLTARKSIAGVLECEPQNIYFTSGGTESDNWALIGSAESRCHQGRHIITSKIEHHAIIHTCQYLEKRGYEVTYLDVDEQGRVELERLQKALRRDTILVSIMTANNEIGTIQPIEQIGLMLANHPALFHTDAVQAFGHIPVLPEKWKVDLLSASGHKFHGPKGIGFLYVREGIKLPSFLHGGKQERGMRAGTENVPAIVGMGKAAEIAGKTMLKRMERETSLRDYMIHRIETEIPYCRLNGPRKNRLANNVNISFSFVDGETIVILLDMEGICTSSGSACTAGQAVSSHVLTEIGLPEDIARGAVRFTLSEETSKKDIDDTVDILKQILEKNRKMNPVYTSFAKLNQRR
ncbi:MAG: cysteine desulfurase NifS [Lachnospiraceae bacterium]|nr:cysteine desulfurase NifS [Lachnospiraceae bacterium]